MMRKTKDRKFILAMGLILLVQLAVILVFAFQKAGFHYDEYYSYYSSNVTWGLVPTDREWKSGSEIFQEFAVLPGQQFQFSTVVRMQTYDVHPPLYYLLLHAVCSLTPGVFSKWSALSLNLVLFMISWLLLACISYESMKAVWNEKAGRLTALAVCLLYGFNPAVISGIMLARMYMLLTVFVLALTLLHVRALSQADRTGMRTSESTVNPQAGRASETLSPSGGFGWRFYLPAMLTVYLGFLTHYYFAVYLFFLAAAMEFYLLLTDAKHVPLGQRLKRCFVYGLSIAGAMIAAVLSYPACLGHIFRGYRGTEAMGAFFDAANTPGRIRFFIGLLNEYVFGSLLFVILLVLVLLVLTAFMLKKWSKTKGRRHLAIRYRMLWIPAIAAIGYFLVVAKTALLTAEEANRYPLPVYGLILMFTVILTALLIRRILSLYSCLIKRQLTASFQKLPWFCAGAFLVLLLGGELAGLSQGKVLFLYEEDAENIAFAKENHDVPVVYFYNPELMWMIWDDALELMQYDRIYFVNLADVSPITDETLQNARQVLIYSARNDSTEAALDSVCSAVSPDTQPKLIRKLLYCDLYQISDK